MATIRFSRHRTSLRLFAAVDFSYFRCWTCLTHPRPHSVRAPLSPLFLLLLPLQGYYTSEVRIILDGILRELSGHPNRKFVWSEISYFNRWYESLNKDQKEQFKSLVKRGQIEFVNGGWVQSDESAPDPTAIINQLSTGHEYILKNFGVAPRVGWQIGTRIWERSEAWKPTAKIRESVHVGSLT